MKISFAVITLSDRSARGEREDKSGPSIIEWVRENFSWDLLEYKILPDEKDLLRKTFLDLISKKVDVIFTTGGTGVTSRDITPDVTLEIIEKRLHGVETLIMVKSIEITPLSALSRGVIGISGKTLIINLPGSPKAVLENLNIIKPILPHLLDKIQDKDYECEKYRNEFEKK
ncbi:MAG: MogA/MoaB family molybdenum cofactor biosynthesis protein [Dictyoglomaceae bacterium]